MYKKDKNLLEGVQRRVMKMLKGLNTSPMKKNGELVAFTLVKRGLLIN